MPNFGINLDVGLTRLKSPRFGTFFVFAALTMVGTWLTVLQILGNPGIILEKFTLETKDKITVVMDLRCGVGMRLSNVRQPDIGVSIGQVELCVKPSWNQGRPYFFNINISRLKILPNRASEDEYQSNIADIFSRAKATLKLNPHITIDGAFIELNRDLSVKISHLELSSAGPDKSTLNAEIFLNGSGQVSIAAEIQRRRESVKIDRFLILSENFNEKVPAIFLNPRYRSSINPLVHSLRVLGSIDLTRLALTIEAKELSLRSAILSATGSLEIHITNQDVFYNIGVQGLNISRDLIGLLPASIMGDEVYGWLSDKLLKITCASGTAAINGINTELSKLAVDLNCQDVNLNFAGGWPTLKSPQVLIHIAKDSLSIESESVILGGIRCEDVGVSIPSFADANTRMHVKGALSQNLRTLIPALDETPFASITKTVNKLPWHTEGQLEGVLEIQLRLNNSEKIDVKFNGDLIGGALHGKSNLVPLVENISAIISFADDRLVVTQIQGDARWVQKEAKFAAFKFRGEGGLTINPGATSYEFGLSLVPDSLRISSRNLSKFIDNTIDDASIFFAGNDQELRISGVVNKSTYLDSRLQISDGQWGLACWTKKPLTVTLGQARFDTPWADGVIKIESPSDLRGVFAHLTLPDFGIWDDMESGSLSKTAVHSEVIDPRFLPGVSLSVGKLWLGLREIGQISIELAPLGQGS